MARIPKTKTVINTRLANGYGGWIYCEACGAPIGYLCYVTYKRFAFAYQCGCGACGSVHISFLAEDFIAGSREQPVSIKNRRCCSADQSPLYSIVSKNLKSYTCEAVCAACNTTYTEVQTQ